jgi:acyl-CoA synthetase (AMP-forming)/AMP-acid ligase II
LRGDWLRTGDVGYMDRDGFVYISDRLKDMIVTGGENVSASEVEDVIMQLDAVVQVAVVGGRDDVWGERVHAFVVAAPDAGLSEADIVSHCRAKIALYKCPRSVTIQCDPLPMSGAGKVRKDLLRGQLQSA